MIFSEDVHEEISKARKKQGDVQLIDQAVSEEELAAYIKDDE